MKEEEEEREKEEYFNGLEAERTLPGRVLQNLREFDEKNIDLDLILNLVRYITTSMGDGAILIFLPGWDTISKLHDMLMANPVFRGRNYLIIPLHSMMPTAFQQKVCAVELHIMSCNGIHAMVMSIRLIQTLVNPSSHFNDTRSYFGNYNGNQIDGYRVSYRIFQKEGGTFCRPHLPGNSAYYQCFDS